MVSTEKYYHLYSLYHLAIPLLRKLGVAEWLVRFIKSKYKNTCCTLGGDDCCSDFLQA